MASSAVLGMLIQSQYDGKGEKDAKGGLDRLTGAAGGLVDGLGKIGLASLGVSSLVGAAKSAGGAMMDLVGSAEALGDAEARVKAVFGETGAAIVKENAQIANSLGLTQQAYMSATGALGQYLQNMGVSGQALDEMSIGLTELAPKVAAFAGISNEQALSALEKGVGGATRGLKELGIAISEDQIKAKAMELGLLKTSSVFEGPATDAAAKAEIALKRYNKAVEQHGAGSAEATVASAALAKAQEATKGKVSSVTAELDEASKAQAMYALIMEQSANAQAAWADNSGDVEVSMQRLKVSFDDAKASLGKGLLPLIAPAAEKLANLAQAGGNMMADFLGGLEDSKADGVLGRIADAINAIGGEQTPKPLVYIASFFNNLNKGNWSGGLAAISSALKSIGGENTPPVLVGMAKVLDKIAQGDWGGALGVVVDAYRTALTTVLSLVQEKATEWGTALVAWIAPMVSPMLSALGGLIAQAAQWMASTGYPLLVEKLRQWGTALIDWIKPRIVPFLEEVGNFLQMGLNWLQDTGIPLLRDKLTLLADEFITWLGPAAAKFQAEWPSMLEKILTKVGELVGPVGAKLLDLATEFGVFLIREGPGILTKMGEGLATILSYVDTWITNTAIVLGDKLRDEWGPAFSEKMKEVGEKIKTALSDQLERLKERIKAKAKEVGQQIVQGMRDGLDAQWDSLVRFFGGLVNKLPGWAKKLLGISSPSKVFAEIGEQLTMGLSRGIESGADDVLDAIRALAEMLPEQVRDILGIASPSKEFEDLGQQVSAGMAAGLNAETPTDTFADSLAEALARVKAKVDELLGSVPSLNEALSGLAVSLSSSSAEADQLVQRLGEIQGGSVAAAGDEGLGALFTRISEGSTIGNFALDLAKLGTGLAGVQVLAGGAGVAIAGLAAPVAIVAGGVAILALAWHKNWFGMRDHVHEATQGIRTTIQLLPEIIGMVKVLLGRKLDEWKVIVSDKVTAFRTEAGRIATAIIDGLISGLSSGTRRVADAVGGFFRGIVQRAKDAVGAQSPAKRFIEIGRWIMEGLELGIEFGGRGPTQALEDALAELVAAGEKAAEAAKKVRDAWGPLFEGIGQGAPKEGTLQALIESLFAGVPTLSEESGVPDNRVGGVAGTAKVIEQWEEVNRLAREYAAMTVDLNAPLEEQARQIEAMRDAWDNLYTNIMELEDRRHQAVLDAISQVVGTGTQGWMTQIADDIHRRNVKRLEDINKLVMEGFGTFEEAAEEVERRYQDAIDMIERAQSAAEAAEDRVHDQIMSAIEAEFTARERAHEDRMRQLEDARRAEDDLHESRVLALEAEYDKWLDVLDSQERAIDDQAAHLSRLQGELERFRDLVGDLEVIGGDPRQERQAQMQRMRERIQLTTEGQAQALQEALASGLIAPEDMRTVQMLLLGFKQRAEDVERIFAGIDKHLQDQIDDHEELISQAERELEAETKRIQVILKGIEDRQNAEDERHRIAVAGIQKEIDEQNRLWDAEKERFDRIRDAEEARHDQRMKDIAAEFAYQLALLDYTEEQIQAMVAAARIESERVANEAARIYRELMQSSATSGGEGAVGMPGRAVIPSLPPGLFTPPAIGGAAWDDMTDPLDWIKKGVWKLVDIWEEQQREARKRQTGPRVPNYSGIGDDAFKAGLWWLRGGDPGIGTVTPADVPMPASWGFAPGVMPPVTPGSPKPPPGHGIDPPREPPIVVQGDVLIIAKDGDTFAGLMASLPRHLQP